jgi:sterol desaturase/sphingolipid hydroxylase (fatty acid hydroxylase superfamily)
MNPHLVTLWIWYAFVHLRGINNHAGYQLPWLPASEHHDYHHMASTCCYGRTIFLDWLHGTDKGFRAYLTRKSRLEKGNSANTNDDVHQLVNKFD